MNSLVQFLDLCSKKASVSSHLLGLIQLGTTTTGFWRTLCSDFGEHVCAKDDQNQMLPTSPRCFGEHK